MYPQEVHNYLGTFFTENNCQILTNQPDYLTVQLTIDMDKKIMNRPYYWQYLEATNGVPCPAQLTLVTDQNKVDAQVKGEVVNFGSPRLSQLFQVTKELGSFVHLYESIEQKESQSILTPWLGVNYQVSYYSDQTKEMLYSFGINLMTGDVVDNFHESLKDIDLITSKPERSFSLPFIIKPLRALERLDALMDDIIRQDDHSWAEEAKQRRDKDLKVLEYFYEGIEEKPESYELEKKAMEERYEPRIKIEIINGGLFYLQK